MKRLGLISLRRPSTGVGEWMAAMVRGLDALEFLERSRELAAEPVLSRRVEESRVKTPVTAQVLVSPTQGPRGVSAGVLDNP